MIGLVLGSFACVACGDDDDDNKNNSTNTNRMTAEELIGNWYLVDENSSDKVCIDVIQVLTKENLVFTMMQARAKNNWNINENVDQYTKAMTYTFDGKHIKLSEGNMEADITKEGDKYMVQRYNGNQAVGTKIELFKIQRIDEAAQAFALMVASKQM